jgi:hypothetical protein
MPDRPPSRLDGRQLPHIRHARVLAAQTQPPSRLAGHHPYLCQDCDARVGGRFDAATEGGRLIATEFELKLAAPAAELEKLEHVLLAMPTVRSEVQSDLVSTYYDTPTLALYREQLTLRVRRQGRRPTRPWKP